MVARLRGDGWLGLFLVRVPARQLLERERSWLVATELGLDVLLGLFGWEMKVDASQ